MSQFDDCETRDDAFQGMFWGAADECSEKDEPIETIPNVCVNGQPVDVERYDDEDDDWDLWTGPDDYNWCDPHPSHGSQLAVGLGKLRRLGKRRRSEHLDEVVGHTDCFIATHPARRKSPNNFMN